MKKYLLLLVVLLGSVCAYSQNKMVEAIHLKNGSVIKGVIIEQIPDKQITIRTSDGSTFVYPMEDISKITKEEKESKIPFKISNEKYDLTGSRFMIDLGYWAGGYKGPELYFTYGSQINQYLFVGGGTGIHYMTDYSTVSIPIFADVRGYALNGPISPFIALRIGYKFNTKEAPRHAKKGGLYCNPFIGVRFMTTKKQAVNLGIGYVVAYVVTDTKGKTLLPLIYNTVHPNSTIYSDEWYAYNGINKEKFDHQKVYHKKGAYVIGRRSTNTIEGYWSHLKKMISGTHFWVSRKHLQRYVDCESFRYNTKHLSESERFDVFLQNTKRRLRYSQLKKITA